MPMSSRRGHARARPVGSGTHAAPPAAATRARAVDHPLLALQQQAGNAAVARWLAAAPGAAIQGAGPGVQRAAGAVAAPEPGGAATGQAAIGQLGAVWERGVVVPLARAADRLGREEKDLPGARTELATALETIRAVRDGTPADDPNHVRLTSVERIVASVLDVVDARLGAGMSDSQYDRELMTVRLEAVELQPLVTHKPPIEDLVQAILGEGAADFEIPASVAAKSAAELWKVFVIDYLWDTQRDFGELSPGAAWANVLGVGQAIQHFQRAAPDGDPVRRRMFALEAAATALLSRLKERIPADDFRHATADDLADDAARAFDLGVAMKGHLTGQSAVEPAPEGAGEPGFTWENIDPDAARRPFENDTNLMRPGE